MLGMEVRRPQGSGNPMKAETVGTGVDAVTA
jgi:hypothetical protein